MVVGDGWVSGDSQAGGGITYLVGRPVNFFPQKVVRHNLDRKFRASCSVRASVDNDLLMASSLLQ